MASERKAESKLMRWCDAGGFFYDVDEWTCPGCCDGENDHQGRVRRILQCSVCEQGYFNRAKFDVHECHDAY